MPTEPLPPKLIEDDDIHKVLDDLIRIRERTNIPYLFGGGLAVKSLGRERRTKDIDIFVRPEYADRVLDALEELGFKTEKTDPKWLYKAHRDNVPIDIIFKSAGNIYLDEETFRRATAIDFMRKRILILPPEDLVVMKSLATEEFGARHWFDALDIIKSTKIDWEYLKRRAKHGPRRVLSLLFYAQSVDLPVPDRVVLDILHTYLE
ncbi:MAG: nucleotidyltransferase [Nitrospirae bacterium]|nr:nucleotidyltransferase [Candidatus Manganitrophaceae bacterium]